MRILVTGGAGYIGSHAVRELVESGYQVYVLDDLSTGHRKAVDPKAELIVGNTGDRDFVAKVFRDTGVEAVMHFAANIEVAESVADPYKYYNNNFSNSLRLLKSMIDAGVRKLVFSSTAAVYGNPAQIPIEETASREPINPYGRSKMMTEMAIEDFAKAHGLGYVILRYFNVAGASPHGDLGEDHHPESHLIPRILATGLDASSPVRIFGTDYPTPDGTCVRDYLHVVDLAAAHLLALESIKSGKGEIYNLGSEKGFSVREILSACEKVLGRKLPMREESRRPGDPPALVARSEKIRRELGWQPKYPDIESIVSHAWQWHSSHPQGYATRGVPRETGMTAL